MNLKVGNKYSRCFLFSCSRRRSFGSHLGSILLLSFIILLLPISSFPLSYGPKYLSQSVVHKVNLLNLFGVKWMARSFTSRVTPSRCQPNEFLSVNSTIESGNVNEILINICKVDLTSDINESRSASELLMTDALSSDLDYGSALADNESIMDESIQRAVKSSFQSKQPDFSPLDIFNSMLKVLKTKPTDDKSVRQVPDATAMLKKLFPEEQSKDPFDERRVMIKLYQMNTKEDFDEMFKDPIVGDYI